MTCKLSDKCDNVFACNILRPNVELLGCNFYKPKKPQTNEEYIRTANVNDMARLIATKLCELAKHEYGIYDVVDYATVFEWLKEKHNESV